MVAKEKKGGGNSSSTFETHKAQKAETGGCRRWVAVAERQHRWLGGGDVRSRRSSKMGQKARGMGLQQIVARQKEGRVYRGGRRS